jgi:NADH-quinone oxidoreductase subunit H
MIHAFADLGLILVFPGLLFLMLFGFAAEYVDRKLYARLQNRVGPPWFQPLADFIKLAGKQDVIPDKADPLIFRSMPLLALGATVTAVFYIPLWSTEALVAFPGDVVVVLYLLTIPTLTFFLAGWYSDSPYALLGAVRAIAQFFAYEAPLFLAILAPALLADSWSLSEIAAFYASRPLLAVVNGLAFVIALVALLAKLEKGPFDIPEAETEIVAGTFTEYSGRLLAIFRMAINVEMVVGAALIAAVFLPFGLHWGPILGFVLFLLKVLFVVCLLAVLRTVLARLRVDQMINFCWKVVAPLAFAQLLVDLVAKGLLAG